MKIQYCLFPVLLGLISPGFSQQQNPAEKPADYIRFQAARTAADSDFLQTAVARFQRGETIVDLVAAVHLGDKAYFDNINMLLKRYHVVLYEMIGGRFPPANTRRKSGDLSGVSNIQSMATQLLNLEFQLEQINYRAKNFVHADVTHAQYERLKEEKNENLASFLVRAMNLAQDGKLEGIPADEATAGDFLSDIMAALTSGNSVELKRKIAPILSEAESMVAEIEGDKESVIVSERNKVVMAKLKGLLTKSGAQKGRIAIFYGAGHMPDMEKRLIAEGFQKKTTTWVTAWDIVDKPVDPSAPPAAESFFNQLIQENPQMMSIIQNFSKALQDATDEKGK